MKRFLIFGSIILLTMQSCLQLFDTPENSIISETILNKEYKAVSFYKSGNATTQNSIHISILPIHKKIENEDSGNCFIAETNSAQQDNIQMEKETNGQLEIVFKDKLKTIKSQSSFIIGNDTIQIKYIP